MRFKNARWLAIQVVTIFLIAAMSAATRGFCQDSTNAPAASNAPDPLLDLLIQKGILTQQEAERVEAEAQSRRTNETQIPQTQPSKWNISKGIRNIELFGNARLRYEDRYAADPAGNSIDLRRWRYALQVGLRGDLFDQFYYGVRLDTGTSPRSDSVTFGTSASSGPYQGPFGRSNDGVDVGEIYFGWHPWSWLDITIGRMDNPLYTTPMVWSPNITPEGFAERFKYTFGQAQFFANFGQFLYADLADSASPGLGVGLPFGSSSGPGAGQYTDNIFMFAWQGGLKYQITPGLSAKVAASVYNYVGLQRSVGNTLADSPYFGDPYVGEGAYYYYARSTSGLAPGYSGYNPRQPFFGGSPSGGYSSLSYPFNQVGLNDLEVLEFPFELNYKFDGLDAHLFGDFAYNLLGAQRAQDAANAYKTILANFAVDNQSIATNFPAQTRDVKAYQIGIGIGSDDVVYGPSQGLVYATSAHRHDWEIRAYWQHTEQYALDPNLPDVDFFEGAQNMEGIYVAVAYGLTDNLIATFRYGHASRINNLLGTGGSDTGDIPQINPIKNYNIYQMDLTLQF
ncbi:MAG TPA: putative porin [Verrucomicrobiae bacterium]|nr:putative porin [Verrucomicrobiae bacterium]